MPDREQAPSRRRRRAVGPAGARSTQQPDDGLLELGVVQPGGLEPPVAGPDDDERLRREVPPHHGG